MSNREARTFSATAVVLRHLDYGETDRILTLFTLEHGKIKAIAKGVRRIQSRKAGHLEPLTQVRLFLARGRDLAVITQVDTLTPWLKLKDNLQLMGSAVYMLELLERFTLEEGANRDLYLLLVDSLNRLQENPNTTTVVHYYEVRLLDLLGFRPNLKTCVVCSTEIKPEDQYFSAQGGGVVCPRCVHNHPDAWKVSMPALKYFRHFQRSKYSQVKGFLIPEPAEKELAALIERYMTVLLERSLKSTQFLRDIASPEN